VENQEEKLTNMETIFKDFCCEKCHYLETQLQEALHDLSSAKLITELLRKECDLSTPLEQESINSITSQRRLDQKDSDNYRVMSPKCMKGQTSGNINIRGTDSTLPMNQRHVSANHYAALQAYSETHRNDNETNTSAEYELTDMRSKQNSNVNNLGNYNKTTKEHHAASSNQPKPQHNLQNPKKNEKSKSMDEDKMRFSIPTIINRQTIRNEKGRSTTQRNIFQKINKRNSDNVHNKDTKKSDVNVYRADSNKNYVNTALCHKNLCKEKVEHKDVILGDSHTRSLAGRLRDNLSDKFEIMGYTKPNSNTAALLSNTKQDTVNLTYKDVLIFMGGTNDIITNNSNNGLQYISQFMNNNTPTNIVMLTIPHHYDPSYSSDVNKQAKNSTENCVHIRSLILMSLLRTLTKIGNIL
jgi:hypothetical protein